MQRGWLLVSTATGRRLQVLTLLQSFPGITASDLARRLGTSERAARRHVAALRELGYRIDAVPGRHGGYTLGAGTSAPLPVLDAEEVLAAALGLRAPTGVHGLHGAAATALAKLTAILPTRHRAHLEAVAATTSTPASITATSTTPTVITNAALGAATGPAPRDSDPATFTALALACRTKQAVRFSHHRANTHAPAPPRARDTQPLQLVTAWGRWYLVACDRGDTAWRTYAVDRISDVQPLGVQLDAPEPPQDPAALVTAALRARGRHQVRVRVHTSGDLVGQLIAPAAAHIRADPANQDGCLVSFGTDDLDWAARWLVYLNLDFDVLEPASLSQHLHDLGAWLCARYPRPR